YKHTEHQDVARNRLNQLREAAAERTKRTARCRGGSTGEKSATRLGLRKIDFSIPERPFRELSGSREPSPQSGDCLHQKVHHDRTAMSLQLGNIFAGERTWSTKE